MSTAEDIYFILGLAFFFLGFLMLSNAIYFQMRYQKKADQLLHGDNYIDGGWVFNSHRMMMYAHYCLFHKRAARDQVLEQVLNMPKAMKFHLILHWGTVTLVGLTLIIGFVINYFFIKL